MNEIQVVSGKTNLRGRDVMYGRILCPKIHIMSYTLHTIPYTHTGLNKARYSYTQLYTAIHS